ncbi:MAG: hypothetical protein JXD19_07340 [Deltaproteobacteria bacterium]|nr:hypothetical protein [Deltaproteobacteria bacterium]
MDAGLTKEALTQEYLRHREELFAYLFRMVGSYMTAEDLVQEVAVIMLEQQIPELEGTCAREMFFKIAADLSLEYVSQEKLWPVDAQDKVMERIFSDIVLMEELDSFKRYPKITYSVTEHVSFCFDCHVRTLPPPQQAALLLTELFSLSSPSVAQILGVSAGQLHELVRSARQTLTELFRQRCLLISPDGYCRHCDSLNVYYNQHAPRKLSTHLFKNGDSEIQEEDWFFDRLLELVKSVNPIREPSRHLHDFLSDLILSSEDSG